MKSINNEIVYEFEKADLKTKKKRIHKLVLKGYWKVDRKNRLYYELEKESAQPLKFQVGEAVFEKNRIKYKLMVGMHAKTQHLTFSGKWRLHKKVALGFAIDYGRNNEQTLTYTGEFALSKTKKLTFRLNEKIAIRVSQKLTDENADLFMGIESQKEDYAVKAGLKLSF